MNSISKRVVALAIFALAVSGIAGLTAAASSGAAPHGQSAIVARGPAAIGKSATRLSWAVLRVTVSASGNVDAIRVGYNSGNPGFNRSALEAVSKTTFVPAVRNASASTFDYLLMLKNGQRVSHIMAHAPGNAQTSMVANVRVPRQGNAWLSNVDECQLSEL
jgi:TonB family protein